MDRARVAQIGDCEFIGPRDYPTGLLSACTGVKKLDLKDEVFYIPDILLVDLPASLRTLLLLAPSHAKLDALDSILPSLEELWLDYKPTGQPGNLTQLISKLQDIRWLSITSLAVTNLSAELLRFKHLTRVDITASQGAVHHHKLDAGQVMQLIWGCGTLKRFSAELEVTECWSFFEVIEVKNAAELNKVELDWSLAQDQSLWLSAADIAFIQRETGDYC